METNIQIARLRAAKEPSAAQKERLLAFLEKEHGPVTLVFEEDKSLHGFVIQIGDKVYDQSVEAQLSRLKTAIGDAPVRRQGVISLLNKTVENFAPQITAEEVGTVTAVYDGIATVEGLHGVFYGEILLFSEGVRGMVQQVGEKSVGCMLFDTADTVCAGDTARRTKKVAGIAVDDDVIGRVLGPLGQPLDGEGEMSLTVYRPLENPAPAILDRSPVNRPLETGILTIDSMFPIGRGQRELIIGDRQTGKTAIALDTILNQKGRDVICIYVAIGQKASSVAQLVESLKRRGAMDYTVVVAATASDSAPLQYIAPYAGCAIGEYFMEQGKDVLIVYDDLSKHAVAYRSLSLLLDRSPGREAYPGDVFYLHSRLLERAAQLSPEKGGGSMTALPIVETQAGDVSAYIPTNIISITDGQIFLESELFFAGHRPAVHVGLSVSRVGGDAQSKAVKNASGALRLELAQYREMRVFTQFAGDLDDATKNRILYGERLMQMLRQPQYTPYKRSQMVILLVAALSHVMDTVDPKTMRTVCADLLVHFQTTQPALCERLEDGVLSEQDRAAILAVATAFLRG